MEHSTLRAIVDLLQRYAHAELRRMEAGVRDAWSHHAAGVPAAP